MEMILQNSAQPFLKNSPLLEQNTINNILNSSPTTYYSWEFSRRNQNHSVQSVALHTCDLNYLAFAEGKNIQKNISPITFIAQGKINFTDYLSNSYGLPLITINLRQAFEKFGLYNVQYFSAQILDTSHKLIRDDYFVANITEAVPCFDSEKSAYDVEAYTKLGLARRIKKLVLRDSMIKGRHLFRMAESWTIILASGALRDYLASVGISGVEFAAVT